MSADINRNARIEARYDELMRIGKHGHYETTFQVVREEIERIESAGEIARLKAQLARAKEALILAEPYVVNNYEEECGEEAAEAKHVMDKVAAVLAELEK